MSKIDWLNRLGKWRAVFAGWQLGTRVKGDPECDAVRDHREVTMMMRAECNAIVRVMIEKKIIGVDEFTEILQDEAHLLSLDYERKFPGFEATDDGINVNTDIARKTMEGWRP